MGGFKDDVPIESAMVSRRIDGAQKKREEYNFEIRKNLLDYDEVMDEQRKRIYSFRQKVLDGASCREIVLDMVRDQVDLNLASILSPEFGCESFASFAGHKLSVELEPKGFRRLGFDEANRIAKEEAERRAETDILGAIDENLPQSEEQSEWNWGALAKFGAARWQLNIRETDLKKAGRDRVDEFILEKAREAIRKVDLSESRPMLEDDYSLKTALFWVKAKFGLEIDPKTFDPNTPADNVKQSVVDMALRRYDEKEAEYPVMAGFYRFDLSTPAQPKLDREGLAQWASQRFDDSFSLEQFNNIQRDEIRKLLVEKSRVIQQAAQSTIATLNEKISKLSSDGNVPLKSANGAASSLSDWFRDHLRRDLPLEQVDQLEPEQLKEKLEAIVEDHFHPEMRRMERMVLLDVVDSAWKDHLLAMDYLRSAVSQRGMAQLDPKVEYKREGMRLFGSLWQSIGERVTDLVFRMEQMNEGAVRETFVETKATHAAAPSSMAQPMGEMVKQQQQAIDQAGQQKVETIRNRGEKVGRNDPCPCGSGKKYKACCLRKE